VTGNSNSTYINYSINNSGLFGAVTDSSTFTAATLPWVSDTVKATQGQIANMSVTIDGTTSSPSVTMEIYSDGTKVKSTTCTGSGGYATMQLTL
jgi:hypothetical protein